MLKFIFKNKNKIKKSIYRKGMENLTMLQNKTHILSTLTIEKVKEQADKTWRNFQVVSQYKGKGATK